MNDYYTLAKAALRLSDELAEPFDEAEILNLALQGRIRLSVFFQSHTLAECSVISDSSSPLARKTIELEHGLYRLVEEQPRHISGLWDLPLLGAGLDQAIEGSRAYIESRYRELTGEPVPPRSGQCGAYVTRPDGTRCRLVKKYDPNEFPDESKPGTQPATYLPTDGFPDDAMLVVRTEVLREYVGSQVYEKKDTEDDVTRIHQADTKPHPLAVFRGMNNLRFDEIRICVDCDNLALTISARGKKESSIPLYVLGLTKKNAVSLNAQGEAFMGMARGTSYEVNKKRVERLSKALRDAFDTSDSPFDKLEPRFTLSIPKDKDAKQRGEHSTSSYDDGIWLSDTAHDEADEFLRKHDPHC